MSEPVQLLNSRPDPRRLVVQLVVLATIVWFLVVPQLRGSSGSLHLLGDIDSGWIPLGGLAELVSLLVFALATRALLRRHTRPALHRVLRIDLSTIALSHCLPGGGAAGSALGWRLLRRAGVPSAEAGFAKLAQGIGSAAVLQALLLIALLLALPAHGFSGWTAYVAVVDVGLVLSVCAAIGMLRRPAVRRRVAKLVDRPVKSVALGRCRESLTRVACTAQHQVSMVLSDRRRLVAAAGWAAANWTFDCLALWASLRAYGRPVSADDLALTFGIASTAAWLPLTPSGLGVSEGIMIPLLVVFGCTRSVATLGVLTWRVLSFWLPIPIGAAAFGSLRSRAGSQSL